MQRRTEHESNERAPSPTRCKQVWRGRSAPPSDIAPPPVHAETLGVRRRSGTDWLTTTPSWLLSLIFHLGSMLILASLVVPLSRHSKLDRLWVSFATDRESELSQAPVTVVVPQSVAESEQENPEESSDATPPTDREAVRADRAPAQPAIDLSKVNWAALKDLAMKNVPVKKPRSITPSSFVRIDPVASLSDPLASLSSRFKPNEHDEIVNRFIEFDVGRLRGRVGRQAQRRFQALGTEAIPALVRGLNKSASIHASCPVGVISAKLTQLMKTTRDNSRIEYALNQLGKDVPRGAPHRSRVLKLRNRLANDLGNRRESVIQGLKQRGWAVDERTAQQVSQSMGRSDSDLATDLRSDDVETRAIAAMAITLVGKNHFERPSRLGLALADAMDSEPDDRSRELMQQASAALIGRSTDLARTGSEWTQYWNHQDQVALMSPLTTPRLLRQLQSGEEATRLAVMDVLSNHHSRSLSHAIRFEFARVIVPDLDSPSERTRQLAQVALVRLARGRNADETSSERWQEFWQNEYLHRSIIPRSEAQLLQAQTLEERNNLPAARSRYEQIIESFPQTPAAKQAQRLRDAIIQRSGSEPPAS